MNFNSGSKGRPIPISLWKKLLKNDWAFLVDRNLTTGWS
jgi:hypothetical protein